MSGNITLMIIALITGVVGLEQDPSVSYRVGRVVSSFSATTFTCRVRDYVWSPDVDFRVTVRNCQPPSDPNAAYLAQAFLYERLSGADQIVLNNVQDHGYFHLTADVVADGNNVTDEMLQQGLLVPPEPQQPGTTTEPSPAVYQWPITPLTDPSVSPPTRRATLSSAALRRGLALQADLSVIGPETTFEEALKLISEAVRPRLPMLILWNDLERNALVRRDQPVGIEGFGRMRLDTALKLILQAAAPSGTRLKVISEGGVLTIASEYAGLGGPRNKVYSAADLLTPQSAAEW